MTSPSDSDDGTDFDDYDDGRSPELMNRIDDASWAVAARDCAIEVGDSLAAAAFADQAREAIARAAAAGIEPPELAAELDYPGGHTAMDGPHIDHEIAALPRGGSGLTPPGPANCPPGSRGWARVPASDGSYACEAADLRCCSADP
jgi:hypothetical protein